MGAVILDDILVTPLRRIETAGGDVLHGMKSNDLGYAGFGEAYFSCVSPGAVKAWKRHTRMTMNIVVPLGKVRFVFTSIGVDNTQHWRVEDIGDDRYARLSIPPGIWFGFQGLGTPQNLVLNIANIAHDSNEVERCLVSEIEYGWT
jgi:dTDP-4-dehydrorhamnose 3,5-epimerase